MDYYPPVSFSFSVWIGSATTGVDCAFQQVSGLQTEMETTALREGGENQFVHQLPIGAKNTNVTLTRGLMVASSDLFRWAKATLEGGLAEKIEPKSVMVSMFGPQNTPIIGWALDRAWPVKFKINPFEAEANKVAIEEIELAYGAMTRKLFQTQKKNGFYS